MPPTAAAAGRQAAEGRRSPLAGLLVLGLFVGGLGWALVQIGVSLSERAGEGGG